MPFRSRRACVPERATDGHAGVKADAFQIVPKKNPATVSNQNAPHLRKNRKRNDSLMRKLRLRRLFQEEKMDWNRVEGNWKQMKGKVKEKWGKLTDDDLDVINGRRDQLEGKIQERYGIAKDQVARDIDAWYNDQRW